MLVSYRLTLGVQGPLPPYLGRHELGRSAKRAGCRSVPHVLLAETIIGNLDVTVQREKNVVELEITVDDTVLVEILQGQAHLGSVEPIRVSRDSPAGLASQLTVRAWCQTARAECATSDHHH